MRKHWQLPNAIVLIATLLLGAAIGKFVKSWPLLQLKHEIDLIGAISTLTSIVLTVIVAYWIANYLDRSKEANRFEKDLFIKRLEDINIIIGDLNRRVSYKEVSFSDVTATIKRISVELRVTFSQIETCGLSIDRGLFNGPNLSVKDLRRLLTDTPVLNVGEIEEAPIAIRDGIIHIENNRKLEIDASFDELKAEIFKIELAINRS